MQTNSGVHPASYPNGNGILSLGVKLFGCEADHAHPSSDVVRNVWNCTSIPPHIVMVWCLIKWHLICCSISHRLHDCSYFVSLVSKNLISLCNLSPSTVLFANEMTSSIMKHICFSCKHHGKVCIIFEKFSNKKI